LIIYKAENKINGKIYIGQTKQTGAMKGKHHSEETRQKMKQNHKGMKGKHHTEEAKANIRIAIAERKLRAEGIFGYAI